MYVGGGRGETVTRRKLKEREGEEGMLLVGGVGICG
jgi:hypothetical protein